MIPRPSPLATPSREREANFVAGDSLRAWAALGVFSVHAAVGSLYVNKDFSRPGGVIRQLLGQLGLAGGVALAGGTLIFVFFVLSGYLLSRPFVTAYVASAPRPSVRAYLRRRAFRVLPGLWLAALVTLMVFTVADEGWWRRVAPFLLVQNIWPSDYGNHIQQIWSVDVEVAFYLLLPLAFLAAWRLTPRATSASRRAAYILIGCGVVFLASVRFDLSALSGAPGWNRTILVYGLAFMPGIALAVAERTSWRLRLARAGRGWWPAALIAAGATFFLTRSYREPTPYDLAGAALAAGAIVGACLMRQWGGRAPWAVLCNRATRHVGKVSYSFFLFHYGVLLKLDSWIGTSLSASRHFALTEIGGIAITLALATLSYHFIEAPFMRRGRRSRHRLELRGRVVSSRGAVQPSPEMSEAVTQREGGRP